MKNKLISAAFETALKILGQPGYLTYAVCFISKNEIKKLNNNFRGINKETDVLSFPNLEVSPGDIIDKKNYKFEYNKKSRRLNLGDIYICSSIAKSQAEEYGHSEAREVVYLFVHGLLHLLGYNHIKEEDKKIMREIEENVLNELKIIR